MNQIIERITNLENLYWAWEKTKNFYRVNDIWFNEIEVAKFEANLDDEIRRIKQLIESGRYRTLPIRPVAFPKSPDENGPRTRQTFWISVRDQVTWLAVVNIIGPDLDYRMQFWSYAYRLYLSIFYDTNEIGGKCELKFGWYRNTSKHTYRKWNQSWPLYRRHISIVSKIMLKQKKYIENPIKFKDEELDLKESETLEQNDKVPSQLKVAYLEKEYWDKDLNDNIYWAGIDFEKFYPSIKLETIVENIKLYYPNDKYSTELESLLLSLLKFRINKSGWNYNELETIGIKKNDIYLNGLPTGLFVAGFLANVVLLRVDDKVNDELKKRKNVAHFRFVDDHVILADSFNELCEWIKWYEELLKSCNVGVKINIKKTEPESLGKYIKNYRECDLITHEIKERALHDTKLDPNFPSPLMTQTLAKVSMIAQTDINLLDESEEERLIADIEHLLVTDFPDQELRRDTRVSFAASKLSQIVPKKRFDISKLFECEKEIASLDMERGKCLKNIKDIKVESSIYMELNDKISKIKKEITVKNSEKQQIESYLIEQENKLINHTFKLLLKSINDNHEKVRLWARAIEYCRKVGIHDFSLIIEQIQILNNKEICNDLSSGFIISYILHVFTEQIISCYFTLKDSTSSYINRRRAMAFFEGVLCDNFLKSIVTSLKCDKFYQNESLDLFMFTIGSVLFLLNDGISDTNNFGMKKYEHLVENFKMVDWENPEAFFKSTEYTMMEWAWWILQKTTDKLSTLPNKIWLKVTEYFSDRSFTAISSTSKSIIALFPHKISGELFESINQKGVAGNYFSQRGEGWVFDTIKSLHNCEKIDNYSAINPTVNKIYTIIKATKKGYISLYDWTNWMHNRYYSILNDEPGVFDPRISEWTCLEIVRQIANLLEEKIYNIDYSASNDNSYYKVHPSNYLIPVKWKDNKYRSWEDWKNEILLQREKIVLRRKNEFIYDFRYTPQIMDPYNTPNINLSIVNGLGVILVGLLTKCYILPPYYNVMGLARIWDSLITSKIKQYPVSSKTIGVIEACFSKRNRETRFVRIYQRELNQNDDTIYDPPEIFTISELLDNIKDAQRVLESYQLTVQDHQPRQLIPISLIQFTRKNSIYQVQEEGDDQ